MFCESFVDVVGTVKDGRSKVFICVDDDVVRIVFEGMECCFLIKGEIVSWVVFVLLNGGFKSSYEFEKVMFCCSISRWWCPFFVGKIELRYVIIIVSNFVIC